MSETLQKIFNTYRPCFRTKTHDSSLHGWTMLKGYLLLETNRTYKNIDQKVNGLDADGQNLQQFMSDSPWEWDSVFNQVHSDINSTSELRGGTLNFDESGNACSGTHKAGAARQYLGRLGKVELGQMGVLSSFSKDGIWLLTGGELYLPQKWFSNSELLNRWKRLRIPEERVFKTKIDLAKDLFDKALVNQLAFNFVGADTFYGRSLTFRRHIADKGKRYLMQIPNDEQVWLQNPLCQEGSSPLKTVKEIAQTAEFEPIEIRDSERGKLVYDHAFVPVWTVNKSDAVEQREARKELLVIRKEKDGSRSFSLTNASLEEVSKQELALQRAERYFVERTIQDCKSELGWDELQALKYPAYLHTLAICALALVFMAKVKIDQRKQFDAIQAVQEDLQIDRLPDLSLANVKELMKSVMPLPRLSKEQARQKVIHTLFDRSRSTASRRSKQKKQKIISKKT